MGHIYYGFMQLSCYSVSASRRSLLSYTKGTSRGRPIEQKMRFVAVLAVLLTTTAAEPGLLRVPKVYNAVITSNQNLSPSRAYPVIQPVVHRTAIGYVPPFDYTQQVVSSVPGQEAVYLPQVALQPNSQVEVRAEPSSVSVERSKPTDVKGQNPAGDYDKDSPRQVAKDKNEEQEPLSFYPNDLSLYYDPYVNPHPYFNGFRPLLLSSLYHGNRQQQYGPLEPIPASTPKYGPSGQLLPAFHEEKRIATEDRGERIPDVPPPPLPTALPKSS